MVNNSDAKTSDDNEPLVRIEEMSVEEGEAFMDDFWDEVKAKLVEMGLSLKDSAPGFDPTAALAAYGDEDDDESFVEDEQY